MNVWHAIVLTQSFRTETREAFLKALGLLLHRQIILDGLYTGNLPGGPGRIGTGHDVIDLAGQGDDPRISLNSNIGFVQMRVHRDVFLDAFRDGIILVHHPFAC